jgi:hypothetical protein
MCAKQGPCLGGLNPVAQGGLVAVGRGYWVAYGVWAQQAVLVISKLKVRNVICFTRLVNRPVAQYFRRF